MKIILSLETKREIHRKHPDLLLCFLFTVVSTFACLDAAKCLSRPGIEPGSTAWKTAMLTTIPPTRGWLIFHFPVTLIRQRTTLFSGQLALLKINYKQTLSAGS